MNLTVKGKNIDVGDALKTRAQESLDHIFGKYFSNPIEATVTMSKETYLFASQISVHVGRGIMLQAEGEADTANAAYDAAALAAATNANVVVVADCDAAEITGALALEGATKVRSDLEVNAKAIAAVQARGFQMDDVLGATVSGDTVTIYVVSDTTVG